MSKYYDEISSKIEEIGEILTGHAQEIAENGEAIIIAALKDERITTGAAGDVNTILDMLNNVAQNAIRAAEKETNNEQVDPEQFN